MGERTQYDLMHVHLTKKNVLRNNFEIVIAYRKMQTKTKTPIKSTNVVLQTNDRNQTIILVICKNWNKFDLLSFFGLSIDSWTLFFLDSETGYNGFISFDIQNRYNHFPNPKTKIQESIKKPKNILKIKFVSVFTNY